MATGECSRYSAHSRRVVLALGSSPRPHPKPGEEPEDAAVREVREETGLAVATAVQRFGAAVSISTVRNTVELAVVFAASSTLLRPSCSATNTRAMNGLSAPDALNRFFWPRSDSALRDGAALFRSAMAERRKMCFESGNPLLRPDHALGSVDGAQPLYTNFCTRFPS